MHPQAATDFGFECDVDLLPLINLLNANGLKTIASCQGYSGKLRAERTAYIVFDECQVILSFMKKLLKEDEQLYYFLLDSGQWEVSFPRPNQKRWFNTNDNTSMRWGFQNMNIAELTNDFRTYFNKCEYERGVSQGE